MKLPRTLLLCSPLILPFAFIAATATPTSTPVENATLRRAMERQGTIAEWTVRADGTVGFRLRGEHDGKPFSLWFKTPPNRTSTTRFEDLALDAVLATAPQKRSVTCRGESSESSDGESYETAYELLALSRTL